MFEQLGPLSLDTLRTFEAAARHSSFTAAALELGSTQPAVSQQIKRLEGQLKHRLFDRIYRGIALTEAGERLFQQVTEGFGCLEKGLVELASHNQREVLEVATDFAFAAYWLMPRLHRFHQTYPNVDVSIVTGDRTPGALRGDTDIAIVFGDGRFPGHGHSHWLFNEEVFPVCSPRLMEGRSMPMSPASLRSLPLLHLRGAQGNRWFDWAGLFNALGISAAPAPGQLRFDNYTLLIQAAIGGQGVAIGWRHLVDGLIEQGLLCRPVNGSVRSELGYHLLLPPRKRRGRMIEHFVAWLMTEQAQ
ncbi:MULTISPECIES: choline sulfate utilization transcriptional regulator [Pseudomonas]|uniref:LysR family transcriptional regulator n=1 Tax=Pseudomonas quercus TaxID=2722792 RepID=A0ABX0YHP3_9PSED|nr:MULTISPECIES: LysR family transcriptional regulator [Pseudomonas]MBF7144414.1 LysR family transcriptional regulator [Pseudomonas sp. LY10J]NJP02953.1 LysR family transcriptional regulator [Pseudomonas quercus]